MRDREGKKSADERESAMARVARMLWASARCQASARGFLKSFDVKSKLVTNEFSSVAGNCDLLKDPKIACLHRQDRLVSTLRSFSGMKHLDVVGGTGKLKDVELKVTNFESEDKGVAMLAGDIFDVPIRPDIVHRVVRWQLAKRRQGTHTTRGVSEVSGTGRKPRPQKGTGTARHGSLRGPQFRGGATQHGPKTRSHEIGLQKQVRRLGLKVALSARVSEGKLMVFDSIEPPTSKTREMERLLTGLGDCKKFLFVDETEKVNDPLCRATGNLHYANVLPAKGLNVYSILQHDTLVMTVGAIRRIEERLHTPINR